ncbi:MAG: type III PLP-dependent enzyme [Chitinophagales bacterium]|nr:type III PLP-dependent enzyme [Hyphomicrobiales bacterium]
MDKFKCAAELVRSLPLEKPVIGLRPHAARRAARWFLDNFPGEVLYALKANSSPEIVQTLYDAGVRHFDVASLPEVHQAAVLPGAEVHVMHPVKSRRLIAEAYHNFGVRTFALDSEEELEKILAETNNAKDLTLMVRLACPSNYSQVSLEGKFGISWHKSPELLRKARFASDRFGVTFHVGSQAMSPMAYGQALRSVSQHIVQAAVTVDVVDCGGGFPSRYPDLTPPPLSDYVTTIAEAFEDMTVSYSAELWCEPGRALVAEAESVIMRVEARKGSTLYVNDGAFGTLFDAALLKFVFPARAIAKPGTDFDGDLVEFDLYGPTCDSFDYMPGPFMLPADVAEGDFVEVGNIGAYGRAIAGNFNGFGEYESAVLTDEPMLTMYGRDADAVVKPAKAEVIALHN